MSHKFKTGKKKEKKKRKEKSTSMPISTAKLPAELHAHFAGNQSRAV